MSSKLGVIKRGVLGVKMRLPGGVKLDAKEADYVIDNWEQERGMVASKTVTMEETGQKIERQLARIDQQIPDAIEMVREAKEKFNSVKSPIYKEKWGRKLLVRSRYHQDLRNSKQTLEATAERIKDAVDDAHVVYKNLNNRIEEAKIYEDLNGGLHLVGKALVEARRRNQLLEISYNNVEVSMESLEAEVSGEKSRQDVIASAEKVAKSFKKK